MSHRNVTALLLLVLVVAGCDDVSRHYAGVSGHSFTVPGRFVILNNGYSLGDVTWVVVRDWPASSTLEQRLADGRLVLGRDAEYRVRQSNGELALPTPGLAYVFDGDRLTTFPVQMREDDFISFKTEQLKAYSEIESFLRRFERKN